MGRWVCQVSEQSLCALYILGSVLLWRHVTKVGACQPLSVLLVVDKV